MATSIRLFVDAALSEGAELPAREGQAHYLSGVLRRGRGDPVVLFNGRDGEWAGEIEAVGKHRATFRATALLRPQSAEPGPWLVFGLLKRDTTDLVVQKATELGAARILPVLTAHGQAHRVNLDRLRAIAMEAAEQCERLTIPDVAEPLNLPELLSNWPADRTLAAAVERIGDAPFPARQGGLLVGPEGGFSAAELDALRRHAFVEPVTLGPRILRAETAAIAGLTLLQVGNIQARAFPI